MSQTIASTSIQINSFVDKIQLTITGVTAVINGVTYNVTTLSNTLVMAIANSQINQKLSGVLVDFNPTLVQIQSTGTDGNSVNSYVLVPSATATIVNNLDPAQGKVGAIHNLGPNDRNRMAHLADDFSSSISIESASLSVNGNTTSLSVTLKNNGNSTFRIFGLMLQGQYNVPIGGGNGFPMPGQDNSIAGSNMGTVPFQINGISLVPLFGPSAGTQPMEPQNVATNPTMGQSQGMPPVNLQNTAPNQPAGIGDGMQPMPIQNGGPQPSNLPPEMNGTQPVGPQNGPHDDRTGNAAASYLALQPGQTVTLSFSGIIALPQGGNSAGSAIAPIVGNYTVQLMGEGFQTYMVTATS